MYPTILDIQTKQRRTVPDQEASVFWWTEGNGSCDCNRSIAMGYSLGPAGSCLGNLRFLVVDVHGDLEGWDKAEVLAEANRDYPKELVQKFIG